MTEPPVDEGPVVGFDSEVWEAVKQLPPRQRAVIGLFYQEDLSTAEIADALGCSVSTTTSHLNQARTSLAGRLKQPDHRRRTPTPEVDS